MDSNSPVTIIVKASNQQFADQTVQCELSWTIKRLKGLLSEVYPSKPKTDEQKLIYSGQLLNDAIILKDVLRQYEGQDTHTVHLVLQPKNRVFESVKPNVTKQKTTNTNGLRQRNTNQPADSTGNDGIFRPMADWSNNFDPEFDETFNRWAAQQMASYNMMIDQIYRQYYSQYMSNINQSNPIQWSQNGGANNLSQLPYPHNYYSSPLVNSATPPVSQPVNNVQPEQPPAAPQPLPEQQPNPAQQRFPNIVQEEVENRDWLDLFYAFSRLMVLVALVYFYSSPIRCLIVIFFTILYYGYHVGYFRQINREPNNNQPPVAQPVVPQANNNNENPAVQAGEQQQNHQQAPVENEENAADAEPLVNQVASPADAAENDNNRTPVIVLIRTFIMSFFASLIPETPAL